MDSDKIALWLESTISALVSSPDDVKVSVSKDDMGILYTVKVGPEDNGKVIGKGGDTAKAIRTLLHAVGIKNQIRASLKIDAPEIRRQ